MICHGWEIRIVVERTGATLHAAASTHHSTGDYAQRRSTANAARELAISRFLLILSRPRCIGSVTAWADSRRSSRGPGGDRLGPAASVTAVPSGWAVAPLGPPPPGPGRFIIPLSPRRPRAFGFASPRLCRLVTIILRGLRHRRVLSRVIRIRHHAPSGRGCRHAPPPARRGTAVRSYSFSYRVRAGRYTDRTRADAAPDPPYAVHRYRPWRTRASASARRHGAPSPTPRRRRVAPAVPAPNAACTGAVNRING